MSRIGRLAISVPKNVTIEMGDGKIRLKGPKGECVLPLPPVLTVEMVDGKVAVKRKAEGKQIRQLHGMLRSKIASGFKGITELFKKELLIVGVGYRAQLKGKDLQISLGLSHPISFPIPEGVKVSLDGQTKVLLEGVDKELIGKVASEIRALRPPDVYKGKGIMYAGEILRKKVGKAAG